MESGKSKDRIANTRLKPCPAELAAWMRDVNLLPPDSTLMAFHDAAALVTENSSDDQWRIAKAALEMCLGKVEDKAARQQLEEIISRAPTVIRDNPISNLEDRIYWYEFFRVSRSALQSQARMNTLLTPIVDECDLTPGQAKQLASVWLKGSLEPDEVSRIRECWVCLKIFWAGRSDQRCCSPRCNHIRHSRLTREKYSDGYYQGARLTKKEQREQGARRRKATKKRN